MPPPRRQPPPPQGEPKTILIVFLVIFILTTITLGGLAYKFQSENADALKQKVDADKAKTDAIKQRDEFETKYLVHLIYDGTATSGDRERFTGRRGDAKTVNDELEKLNTAYGPKLAWNPGTEAPVKNALANTKELEAALQDAQNKLAAAEAANKQSLTSYQQDLNTEQQAKTKALDAARTAGQGETNTKAAKAKELTDALEVQTQVREQLASALKSKESSDVDSKKKIKDLEKRLEEKDNLIRKIQSEMDLKRDDILATDKPKGKITRVDNRAGVAYVNIGSADFARPQLTFSVLAPSASGGGPGKRERKGALEVVKVLGEHLSQARIMEVTNPLQDPILEGDLIFNPAWDPNQRERIALAGLIDVNGDGLDDTLELVRGFEKQGIQVDAYLDLRSVDIKGPGISEGTSFLILGEAPQTDAQVSSQEVVSEKEKKKAEMRQKIQDMKDQATKMGVPIIQAKPFLKRIGYPMARNPSPANFIPAGTLKPTEGVAPPAKKPDEEKPKDEGKKDKDAGK